MVQFNRTRERDLGSYDITFRKLITPFQATSAVITRKEEVQDVVPVGKYRPGAFKVSDIMLRRVYQNADNASCVIRRLPGDTVTYPHEGNLIVGGAISLSNYRSYLSMPKPDAQRIAMLSQRSFKKISADSLGLNEFFGEIGETVSMLKNPLKGARNLLRTVFRRSNGSTRPWRDVCNTWLELRYGFRPLVSTIYDILKDGLPEYREGILQFSAQDVLETSVDYPFMPRGLWSRETLSFWSEGSVRTETKHRVTHYISCNDGEAYSRFKRGGDAAGVLALLYELTPMSFVLDWFYNFGDMLQAAVPVPGIRTMGATYSVRIKENAVTTVRLSGLNKAPNHLTPSANISASASSVRELYLRYRIPTYKDSLPSYSGGVNSLAKLFDSVAIITQRIR